MDSKGSRIIDGGLQKRKNHDSGHTTNTKHAINNFKHTLNVLFARQSSKNSDQKLGRILRSSVLTQVGHLFEYERHLIK